MKTFFATRRIPTSHVYLNHIEQLHNILEDFVSKKEEYRWGVNSRSGEVTGIEKVEKIILKNKPKYLYYFVKNGESSHLIVEVGDRDGVTVTLRNGGYDLYGLYVALNDIFAGFELPKSVVLLRKYWVVSVSSLIITMTILSFVITNFILMGVMGLIVLFWFAWLFISIDDASGWDEIFPDTKIDYQNYNNRLGVPIYSFLISTKSLITIGAAVATIVSTLFILLKI